YLGVNEPFLADLVPALVDHMKDAFPELVNARKGNNVAEVRAILREEEDAFGRTLDRGMRLFSEAASNVRPGERRISGEDAFRLHDTYGFPIDLTEQMAAERGLTVDIGEYGRLME